MSGKTSTAAKNRFNAKNYDNLRIIVPKGKKAIIENYVKQNGQTINGLVNELLRGAIGLTEEEWKTKDKPE